MKTSFAGFVLWPPYLLNDKIVHNINKVMFKMLTIGAVSFEIDFRSPLTRHVVHERCGWYAYRVFEGLGMSCSIQKLSVGSVRYHRMKKVVLVASHRVC